MFNKFLMDLNQILKVFQTKFPFRSFQNGTTGEKEPSTVDLKVQLFPKQQEGRERRKRRTSRVWNVFKITWA